MLLEKQKYEAEKIVSFKILNGDEIVARLVDDDDESFTITTPLAIVPSQNGIVLVPALFSVEAGKNIRLDKKHVMLHGETVDQLADHYREKTTGIQTVRKPGIIV